MPRQYPAEFRHRAIALVRAGKPVKNVAQDLGIRQAVSNNGCVKTASTGARSPAPQPLTTLNSCARNVESENSNKNSK
ncbi:transposase [Pseudoclavibacter helvolus]|uniref:transposase n=1 Tax=Pseudoclavibacter helvolus TaxID=255205 RepID=UPI0012E9924A